MGPKLRKLITWWIGMCDACGAELPPAQLIDCGDGMMICRACQIIIENEQ